MTSALYLLLLVALLGAFDTLYYHEWRARLPAMGARAKSELQLHAFRDFVYAALFAGLPWLSWRGRFVIVLVALFVAEIVLTLWDFVVEGWIRKPLGGVYAGERVMHGVMGIVYGAMLACMVPTLKAWWWQPSALVATSSSIGTPFRWVMTVMAVGVLVSGIRDLCASFGVRYSAWPWSKLSPEVVIRVLLFAIVLHLSLGSTSAQTVAIQRTVVIGFVGGFVRHDDPARGGVQLADRLRSEFGSSVHVEVFENHRREKAREEILQLSRQHEQVKVIIYGISWGGSETVTLARELKQDGIPVALTIQVDSVEKIGEHDDVIPANVEEAANFYQVSGLLHGRRKIRAENPDATRIDGNFGFDYSASSLKCQGYPWHQRLFFRTHVQIECDPKIWSQIEALIRSKLSAHPQSGRSS